MLGQSASINPLGKVGYNECVVCHHCNKNYLIRTIGNHCCYFKSYISQYLGDDETKNVEEEKKKWDEFTKRYQKINHGKQHRRMCEYKK